MSEACTSSPTHAHQTIPRQAIQFHPHSFGDDRMRLFEWNGQLYRGICAKGTPFFDRLFQEGLVPSLCDRGLLIDSQLTPWVLEGYERVVHHRKVAFTVYPQEWCGAMFKDAALTLIDLALELSAHGLTLGDAHPWNILYDLEKGRPTFVDLGSIDRINDGRWRGYDEFCHFCLNPLRLMACGQSRIARLLLCEEVGVLSSDLSPYLVSQASQSLSPPSLLSRLETGARRYLPPTARQWLKQRLSLSGGDRTPSADCRPNSTLSALRQRSHTEFLQWVRTEVEAIALPLPPNPQVSEPSLPSPHIARTLDRILRDHQPKTLLDIGCGAGHYAKQAAALGSRVLAMDCDETWITHLYADLKENPLPLMPVLMDFTKPTPARGLADHWAIAATHRLPCEMVMALGVVDRLVLSQRLNFDQIVTGLAQFSQRWVLVEFIPPEDPVVAPLWSERLQGYRLERFIEALYRRFSTVTLLPSDPEPRILLFCEKEGEDVS